MTSSQKCSFFALLLHHHHRHKCTGKTHFFSLKSFIIIGHTNHHRSHWKWKKKRKQHWRDTWQLQWVQLTRVFLSTSVSWHACTRNNNGGKENLDKAQRAIRNGYVIVVVVVVLLHVDFFRLSHDQLWYVFMCLIRLFSLVSGSEFTFFGFWLTF